MDNLTTRGKTELGISRLLHAPLELVWEVWTKPEHVKNWWGPAGFTNTISKMDFIVGGEWIFVMHGPDGKNFDNKHIFKEILPMSKIVMSHESYPKFTMTITFERKGENTLLNIHSKFESAEELKQVIELFNADRGMIEHVDRLGAYLGKLSTKPN